MTKAQQKQMLASMNEALNRVVQRMSQGTFPAPSKQDRYPLLIDDDGSLAQTPEHTAWVLGLTLDQPNR